MNDTNLIKRSATISMGVTGTSNEFGQVLDKQFTEKLTQISQAILQGQCQDYAEYRDRVGQLRGLRDGHQIIKNLIDQIRDEG